MRAALYNGQKNIEMTELPTPEAGENDMEIMKSRKWNIESIITDVYPWEQLPQAIEKASRVDETLNVVIKY